MAKAVVHLAKVVRRRIFGVMTTQTGTLCNRMTTGDSGLNSTSMKSKVTCKFCLKAMKAR